MKNIITALLALVVLMAFGQETKKEEKKKTAYDIWMYIPLKDHLTHEDMKGATAELLSAADSSLVDNLPVVDNYDTEVCIHLTEPGKYIVRLQAEGYVTAYTNLDASKLHKREQFRRLPTVYMRKVPKKLEVELGEVVVKSTLLKFYMDGDTLVYNADAFPTAEGSMLGELMKKLPGVELEDGGVITVNGRKVESMLLNGKDFFDKDRELLLENMPSYMVKSFNTYERAPESVRGTEHENEVEKEFVMDVRLKKDYRTGWIANAELGGGATFYNNSNGHLDGKHLGRLFGLRFTDHSRMVAYVNANNLNDSHKPGKEGDWGQLRQSGGLTSSVSAGLNFGVWKDEYNLPKQYTYEGSIDGSYSDKNDERQTSRATFLDNGNTYGRSFSASRDYNWKLDTQHKLTYRQKKVGELLKDLSVSFTPKFTYNQWNNRSGNANVTFSEDVAARLGKSWMDSIAAPNAGDLLKRYAINRTMSTTQGNGHAMNLNGSGYININPTYNDFLRFHMNVHGWATDHCSDTYEHYRLDYPTDGTRPTDYRNRYTPRKNATQYLRLNPSATIKLKRKDKYNQNISLGYVYSYSNSDSNNPLYLLNRLKGWEQPDSHPLGMLPSAEDMLLALDRNNSSRSVNTKHTQTPTIGYSRSYYSSKTSLTSHFQASLDLNFTHERQDYQQGSQVDTLMTRNTSLLSGMLYYQLSVPKRGRNISASYNFNVQAPSMTSLLNIRDDSDPLNITLGNPDLNSTTQHSAGFSYRDKFGKTLFNTSIRANLQTNAVAYGFIYDRETGVRTTKPQNVNGNWDIHTDGGIDLPLDKKDRWRLKENLNYDYNHSVDLAGTNAAAEATRSTVGSHYLTDKLSLRYRPTSKLEFGASGSLTYQNSTSNRESFQTLNVFTYHYGGNAQLELPWNFQISTDLTLYARRGYSEQSMNTNELVWNARLAKRLMHGNLTLMFDGFDLLGNLSNVRRTINAQGRTETFYNVIPSYGLFHAIYRLNKQPKNKIKNKKQQEERVIIIK